MADAIGVLGPPASKYSDGTQRALYPDRTEITNEPSARPVAAPADDTIKLGGTVIMRCEDAKRRAIITDRLRELDGAAIVTIYLNLTKSLEVELTVKYDKNGKTNTVVIRRESMLSAAPGSDAGAMIIWANNLATVCVKKLDESASASALRLRNYFIKNKIDINVLSARISNSDLKETDRILFAKYLYALASGDAKGSAAVKKLIMNRDIFLGSDSLRKYTGREDFDALRKPLYAMEFIWSELSVFSKKEWDEIRLEKYEAFLPAYETTLIDNYKKHPSKENLGKILSRLQMYSTAWLGSTWGTPERALLLERKKAFEMIASTYIPEQDMNGAVDLDSGSHNKDYKQLWDVFYKAQYALNTPEKSDDLAIKPELLKKYELLAGEYNKETRKNNPDIKRIIELGELYGAYSKQLDKFQMSDKKNRIISECGLEKPLEKPIKGNGFTIYPSDKLPSWLNRYLRIKVDDKHSYTYGQYVAGNVRFVVIGKMPDQKSVDAMCGGYGGETSNAEMLLINTTEDEDKWPQSYRELSIFSTLIHETTHCFWERRSQSAVKDQSTSNEALAYYEGAQAIFKAIKQLDLFGRDVELAEKDAKDDMILSEGATEVIGSADVYNKATPGVDANIYPKNTPLYKAYELALYFGQFRVANRKINYMRMFEKLILEKTKLEDLKGDEAQVIHQFLSVINPGWAILDYRHAVAQFKNTVRSQANRPVFELDYLEMMEKMLEEKRPRPQIFIAQASQTASGNVG